jgi:hypothetical protein
MQDRRCQPTNEKLRCKTFRIMLHFPRQSFIVSYKLVTNMPLSHQTM